MVPSPTEETWESRSGGRCKMVAAAWGHVPEAVAVQVGGAERAKALQPLLPAPTLIFLEARRSPMSIFQLQDKAIYH